MLVDLAALCRTRPTGNSSERNQTKEDELGISSGPLLTLAVLLEGFVMIQTCATGWAHNAILYLDVVMFLLQRLAFACAAALAHVMTSCSSSGFKRQDCQFLVSVWRHLGCFGVFLKYVFTEQSPNLDSRWNMYKRWQSWNSPFSSLS